MIVVVRVTRRSRARHGVVLTADVGTYGPFPGRMSALKWAQDVVREDGSLDAELIDVTPINHYKPGKV